MRYLLALSWRKARAESLGRLSGGGSFPSAPEDLGDLHYMLKGLQQDEGLPGEWNGTGQEFCL